VFLGHQQQLEEVKKQQKIPIEKEEEEDSNDVVNTVEESKSIRNIQVSQQKQLHDLQQQVFL